MNSEQIGKILATARVMFPAIRDERRQREHERFRQHLVLSFREAAEREGMTAEQIENDLAEIERQADEQRQAYEQRDTSRTAL